MNVETGTGAAQFSEKEYINGIFVAMYIECSCFLFQGGYRDELCAKHCATPYGIGSRVGEGGKTQSLLLWSCIPASLEGPDAVTGNMNIMLFSRVKIAPHPLFI
jgi:hypothetical protein